jgi:DNA-binding transcriptional MerR regulator
MDDGTTRITIGELARRTGLPVRTLRFYSDGELVVPADRSEAGYRLYDEDAAARVALVRTLRELGLDLPTIRRVLDRELALAGVAAAHAAALDAQIRVLRMSRTVARLAARRRSTPQEMTLMHQLARLSEAERRRIVDDFLDEVLGGLDVDPDLAARMRMARPDLPDDPSPEQVEAWIELAELVADPAFRSRIREMSERGAADRAAAKGAGDGAGAAAGGAGDGAGAAAGGAGDGAGAAAGGAGDGAGAAAVEVVIAERAGAALASGIDPRSAAAEPIVAEIAVAVAAAHGREDGADFRVWLAELINTFADARAERYWQLLAVINGWPARPATVPAWEWLGQALGARS